jgi:hypothetical protein
MKRPGFPRDSVATLNEKLRGTPQPVLTSPAPLTLSRAEIVEIEAQLGVRRRARPAPRVIAVPA